MGRSTLLLELQERIPEIASGPLHREKQFWIATGPSAVGPPKQREPRRDRFVEPVGERPLTKPERFGLFTSTGFGATAGMWHAYLQLHRGSTLFPEPWHVWSMQVSIDARILEIASASDWTAFVDGHPRGEDDFLYPDWGLVARAYDGVRMTAGAIAATQGFVFTLGKNVVAPPYWDVESVAWLRWVFSDYGLSRVRGS
jgi:hypothetical protein